MAGGQVHDIFVIGGGINGCGIARDAVGRGYSVVLAEKGDFASGTSSGSTKLIHGGLRYLEYYEFRLVREALMERERLWAIAPHIIWPLRFVLPHHKGLRPAWLLRLGLFLYDHIGGRKKLPATRTLDLSQDAAGRPLKDDGATAFEYSDCWVEDSRLVVLNAMDAAAKGAAIHTRARVVSADREGGLWRITAETNGTRHSVLAKALVNAAGPWVGDVLGGVVRSNTKAAVRMVQGSHIVVPRLYDHDRCYIFQNADGRIIFAIPYERDFTLIGTTDRDYRGNPSDAKATPEEIDYLCAAASEYFREPVTPSSVVWTYSGVRPLYDDGASKAQEATRDYVLTLDAPQGQAPLLSVFGGKITTYRCLAEDALDKLAQVFPNWERRKGWTAESALPGGDFAPGTAGDLIEALVRDYPFLTPREARRLVRHYGLEARDILGGAKDRAGLGQDFGGFLTEAEIVHLMEREFARDAEDVVWRRTKSGLHMSAQDIEALDRFIKARRGGMAVHAAE